MRETRQLTTDDAQSIVYLYSHIRKFKYKNIPEEKYNWFTNIDNVLKLLNEDGAIYIGTFEDGELIASIRMTFWKSMPHWTLGNVITKIHTLSFNMAKNGLAACTSYAIDLAERMGFYRFYTAISQRQMSQALFDKWPQYVPALRDYLYVIEAEIDEGNKSDYMAFEVMLSIARIQDPNLKYYIRSATANNNRRNLKILKEL
jgi:hypothetical protein